MVLPARPSPLYLRGCAGQPGSSSLHMSMTGARRGETKPRAAHSRGGGHLHVVQREGGREGPLKGKCGSVRVYVALCVACSCVGGCGHVCAHVTVWLQEGAGGAVCMWPVCGCGWGCVGGCGCVCVWGLGWGCKGPDAELGGRGGVACSLTQSSTSTGWWVAALHPHHPPTILDGHLASPHIPTTGLLAIL